MLRVADLFAGCGGSSRGAADAGCEVVLACDWDAAALATYRLNFPDHDARRVDLRDVAAAARSVRDARPHVVMGSSPCQSFSTATSNADNADDRATLTHAFARIVAAAAPPHFVLENVPGMLRSPPWADARAILERAGYTMHAAVLDCSRLGVPQRRRRAFVVGSRTPAVVAAYQRAVEALKDARVTTVRDVFPGTRYCWFYARDRRTSQVRPGDQPYPTVRRNSAYYPRKAYTRRPTDKADLEEARVFNVDELAQIQGLENHVWPPDMSRSTRMRQTANAVPPKVMEWVMRTIGAA